MSGCYPHPRSHRLFWLRTAHAVLRHPIQTGCPTQTTLVSAPPGSRRASPPHGLERFPSQDTPTRCPETLVGSRWAALQPTSVPGSGAHAPGHRGSAASTFAMATGKGHHHVLYAHAASPTNSEHVPRHRQGLSSWHHSADRPPHDVGLSVLCAWST